MSQTYGIESHKAHAAWPLRERVRHVIVIDAGGSAIARLMRDNRTQLAEMDASTPEVVQMIQGRAPAHVAQHPEWDEALKGHSPEERQAAEVYTLPI